MTFTEYLREKKYSEATISRYGIYSNRFLSWLTTEALHPETFTYTELLDFMRYCQDQGVTKMTVSWSIEIVAIAVGVLFLIAVAIAWISSTETRESSRKRKLRSF